MSITQSNKKMGARASIFLLLSSIGTPLALFLAAGTIHWTMGWISFGIIYCGSLLSRVLMAIKNPDLIKERATGMDAQDSKAFDRWLVPIVGVIGPMVTFIVAGLNKRYGWLPEVSLVLEIVGIAGILIGLILTTWAMVVNRYFSSVVRIQSDRDQKVIDGGPYRFVRHPAYTASILSFLTMPFMLGSYWALIPASLTCIFIIVRTGFEDHALQAELPGYKEYTKKTRFKLVPGIW